ncbi:protein kinase-like domain-containing protein [Xylariomycetidae sp. FL2044]|nr:protein kinase-like domain-containing protein [Xylariomycetidae sp. FL2044]
MHISTGWWVGWLAPTHLDLEAAEASNLQPVHIITIGDPYYSPTFAEFLAASRCCRRAKDAIGRQRSSTDRDPVVRSRMHRERDRFIDSHPGRRHLSPGLILQSRPTLHLLQAASSWELQYLLFRAIPPAGNGPHEEAERWVVRVPLAPCLAFAARDKLESEAVTMRLVAEKTTIPIPKIHPYALGCDSFPLSTFIILKYVEGEKFSWARIKALSDEEKARFYTALTDIHIQLRRLEFSSSWRLIWGREGFEVCKPAMTIDINLRELVMVQIISTISMFRKHAEGWVDRDLDRGPFVLVYGDLEPFNLMVNEHKDAISVLDWEWSRIVPLQVCRPPLWLTAKYDTTTLAIDSIYSSKYLERFNELNATWTRAKEGSGFRVVNALEKWPDIDWFASLYISWKSYRGSLDLADRVRASMEENPDHNALIAKKQHEDAAYKAEMDRVENTTKLTAKVTRDEIIQVNNQETEDTKFFNQL